MFVVTVIIGQGRYAYAETIDLLGWILIGWYAYKGDIKIIAYWLKWLIFTQVGIILLVYFFIGDDLNSTASSVKYAVVIGIVIMLIPKIALFYYCSLKLEEGQKVDSEKSSSSSSQNPRSKSNFKYKADSYSSTASNKATISPRESAMVNDEIFYEKALSEFESDCSKGLWIKILAKNEGDEIKSKFEYIRIRAEELQIEDVAFGDQQKILNEKIKQEQFKNQTLLEAKIGKHKPIKIKGESCFLLECGSVLYQMDNGDYLIYKNEMYMGNYLEYRNKNQGYLGILKKDANLNIPNTLKTSTNVETVISVCRKCTLRLRVKNSTGMIKCPECGHGWLFEKQDNPFKPINPKIEISSQSKIPLNFKDYFYKNIIIRLISLNYDYGFIILTWIFIISMVFLLTILIEDYFNLGWF